METVLTIITWLILWFFASLLVGIFIGKSISWAWGKFDGDQELDD